MSTIRTCSYCYRKSCWVLLFQCGDCRRSRYCSLVCQRDGWTQHRSVCQAIVARHKARKIARQSARRAIIFLELRAILKIQKCVRGYLQRVKFQRVISNAAFIMTTTERTSTLPPTIEGETDVYSLEGETKDSSALPSIAEVETEDEPREGETKSNSTSTPADEGEIKNEDRCQAILDFCEASERVNSLTYSSNGVECVKSFTCSKNKKYKRNNKCHCGSGKKFKRCCMRHTALSVTPSYCGISVTPKIEEHAAQALLACENPEAALLCRT